MGFLEKENLNKSIIIGAIIGVVIIILVGGIILYSRRTSQVELPSGAKEEKIEQKLPRGEKEEGWVEEGIIEEEQLEGESIEGGEKKEEKKEEKEISEEEKFPFKFKKEAGIITPGSKDSDGDGLTDEQEARIGTDPNKFDTDGDGLSDSLEVRGWHTNPLKSDTDEDGYSDKEEIEKGYNLLGAGKLPEPVHTSKTPPPSK